jgi:hypothetical protein
VKQKGYHIKDMRFEEVKKYEPDICTFESILPLLKEKMFVFELKNESLYNRIIDTIWELCGDSLLQHRFISFDEKILLQLKQKHPNAYCGFIATSLGDGERFHPIVTKKDVHRCVKNGFEELSGHFLTFSSTVMRYAHHYDIVVGVGPVNSLRKYKKCIQNNVDCIYTDYGYKISEYQK